ncbi:MAG: hypothetical protein AAGF74_17750 [Pseudomonadota bacterium]
MQFKMEAAGYNITDTLQMTSKKKLVELKGETNFSWTNSSLPLISDQGQGAYLVAVGQTIQAANKKALAGLVKTIQGLIDGLEKKIIEMEDKFKKKHKKTPPTGKEVEAEVDRIEAYKSSALTLIGDKAKELYKTAIAKLTKPAHDAGCKKIQEGSKLKKNYGQLKWTALKFVLVAAAITLAAVATVLTAGLATPVLIATISGGLALLGKSASLVTSTAKDINAWRKQYRANVELAADHISTAEKTVDKAIEAIKRANQNHEAMTMKIGLMRDTFEAASTKLQEDNSKHKEVAKARADLEKRIEELLKFERQLGGHPQHVLSGLEQAKAALAKSRPGKVADLDPANRWMDLFKNATDVLKGAASVLKAATG